MQKPAGEIVLSASDLSYFAECAHRTWLDRLHLDHPMEKAEVLTRTEKYPDFEVSAR